METIPPGDAESSPLAAALYIAAMADDLARIARGHGLEALGYLLDMARMEAGQIAKGSSTDAGGRAA